MLAARDNPFRMQRIESLRYRLDEAGWAALLARFAERRWRGVLVGPHGSGKTTLREELEARLHARGWRVRSLVPAGDRPVRWADLSSLITGADGRTLISIDGLDRIGALQWWRLRHAGRAIGGILATSHVAGRLPLLHRHHTSAGLLQDLVDELLPAGHHLHQRCQQLFDRHHGDVRACLRALYDEAAQQSVQFA